MNLVKPLKKTDHSILQEIFESLDNALTEGVFRSSPDWRILFANNAMIKMLGYESLEELKSDPNQLLFAGEETRKYLTDRLSAQGFIENYRILLLKKDHRNFWGWLTCLRVMRNGEEYFEGRIVNITDQVTIEEQLKEKTVQLEKKSMELDRFIYSASHDIRSPITSVLGLINIMKLELKDENSKKLLELMIVSMNRLERFVNSLVSFAKNSKKEIFCSNIDFSKALAYTLEKLIHHPNFNKVTVTNEISLSGIFFSDLFRIRLILYNVIKNAYDFCDSNKSNMMISIQIKTLPEKAIIEIFDNGIGIPAKHLEKVFDMFYRGTTTSNGSGIGLYTAREAAIKLGGFITINSEYGIGTSIRIELPNSIKGKLINKKEERKGQK
jgi:signal transduction histidine kinase